MLLDQHLCQRDRAVGSERSANMMGLKSGRARNGAAGACILTASLVVPGPAAAAAAAKTPTFTRDIAPIFQEKCEACHRPDSIAPMSLMTYAEARPWARSIKARVGDRQMPPWQIDRTVGIQKFKNDRSLTDDQVEAIVRWVDAGAPQGDPKDMPAARHWPDGQGWNFAALFGQKEPDLIIKSYDFTMPAVSQDVWDKRITPSGITEPRWVRAIEIRPETLKGRKIVHHAIAYLEQNEPGVVATPGLPTPFMEWAVGKQGEVMRPDTGKLLLPGSKFHWMTTYVDADEAAPLLPKGTILKVTAWHDNTSAKKSNPDPNQWVGWGDRTVDEMAHAWINIVYMKDDDFKIEQDKRRAKETTTLQQ